MPIEFERLPSSSKAYKFLQKIYSNYERGKFSLFSHVKTDAIVVDSKGQQVIIWIDFGLAGERYFSTIVKNCVLTDCSLTISFVDDSALCFKQNIGDGKKVDVCYCPD
ncbi:MAG: hypothetical protein WCT18_02915, partial [Patescibacteria group bacterium]